MKLITTEIQRVAPNTIRQRRYREKHRRIDYVPDVDVLAIILKHRKSMPWNLAGVLDALITAGDKAITGDGKEVTDETR